MATFFFRAVAADGKVRTGSLAGDDYPSTLEGTNVTGFAVGTKYAYYAETGMDQAGYIEKGLAPPFDGGNPPSSIMIARRVTRLIMIPAIIPTTASSMVSRSTTLTMYHFDAPSDFRIPISRVRSITAVYID